MRRSAAACLAAFLLVALVGCEEPQQKEDLQEGEAQTATTMAPDYYASDPAAQVSAETYPTDTYGTDPSYASGTIGATGRTHQVAKGDTLFSLARKYYNDQRRWKEIYEANCDLIRDPNMIFVGQELVIP